MNLTKLKIEPQAAGTYRRAKMPFEEGQLRTRAWRCIVPPTGDLDPMWVERAKEYWELQERLYGVRFTAFTCIAGEEDFGPVFCTYATVAEVLPGDRI